MKKEQRIVILLIKPRLQEDEEKELLELLGSHMDWSAVMGTIAAHRVGGIASRQLRQVTVKYDFSNYAFKRFFRFLNDLYHVQYSRVVEQAKGTVQISKQLEDNGINHAILKGLALSQGIYSDLGCRNFNDTDILVQPNQLQDVLRTLREDGYIQGKMKETTGDIEPVERKQIIIRPMVSHEVIPFQKKIDNNPFIQVQVIDVQFSIDLMTSNRTDQAVEQFLSRKILVESEIGNFSSLSWEDHFLFLCVHFYKEATNAYEVNSYNDLSLYKLCDVAHLLDSCDIEIDMGLVISRAQTYQLNDAVFYTLYYIKEIFGEDVIKMDLLSLLPADLNMLNHVYHYNKDDIAITWNDSIVDRVFNMNRVSLLDKVTN